MLRVVQLELLMALAVSAGCVFQSLEEAAGTESETGEVVGDTAVDPTTMTTAPATTGDRPAETTDADPDPPLPETESDSDDDSGGVPEDEGTGDIESMGACCRPNGTPGCEDMPGAEACVCELDAHCCNIAWDSFCVELGISAMCMECGRDSTVPAGPSDCCSPGAEPGCTQPDVEACVCDEDVFCCAVEWDDACVDQVEVLGCGCGFGPFTDDDVGTTDAESSGGEMQGDCCHATAAPGCLDADIEICVCGPDPFCCDTAWDNLCIAEVTEYDCGSCIYPPGDGECCEVSGGQGCGDAVVQDCVCGFDPQCCTQAWDETCTQDVEFFECGICEPGTMTGTSDTAGMTFGSSEGSETGTSETGTSETGL